MAEKNRILFLSANPWTTSRILVDEEAREIFLKIQEGPYRDKFELYNHAATRPDDLQRLLLLYRPQIVHFSGHGSKKEKIILRGTLGRGKTVGGQGLVDLFTLYNDHVRLVVLNACFTKAPANSISEVIDYAVGTGKGIGDKAGVAFAGAFYRALGFGKCVRAAFASAKAELELTRMPRTQGIELFVRGGISDKDRFPNTETNLELTRRLVFLPEFKITSERGLDSLEREDPARPQEPCGATAAPRTINIRRNNMDKENAKNHSLEALGSNSIPMRKSARKPPGTRVGTIEDWREAKPGKRHGHSNRIRDGR
jgi:hypothetical protein